MVEGLFRELNPGPLAPEARIMPLDQAANVHLAVCCMGPHQTHGDIHRALELGYTVQLHTRKARPTQLHRTNILACTSRFSHLV